MMQSSHVEIPYIPAQVDIEDVIHQNGRLISPNDVPGIMKKIDELGNNDRKYSKKELKTKFSILKIHDQYYAVYKGVKHEKHLGKGVFGTVKLIQNISDGTWAVIKTILKDETKPDESLEYHDAIIQKEVRLLTHSQSFLGQTSLRESKSKKSQQSTIVMKLAPGVSVENFIRDPEKNLPAAKWLDLAIAITRSIIKLHNSKIIHRDIKPSNMIYYSAANKLELVDLGIARQAIGDLTVQGNSGAGSPKYMAPEIVDPEHKSLVPYNEKTEVYALGVSLTDVFGLRKKGDRIEIEPPYTFLKRVTNPSQRELINKLLLSMINPDPDMRPTMNEVMEQLSYMREYESDIVSSINAVAFLNVNDYIQATEFQKNETLKALKTADEVQLCMVPGKQTFTESIKLKHALENEGICVNLHALKLENNAENHILSVLKNEIEFRHQSSYDIYQGRYITPLNFQEGVKYSHSSFRSLDTVKISLGHKLLVQDRLQAQIDTMKKKNVMDSRLPYMKRILVDLDSDDIKNYRELFNRLNDLKNLMLTGPNPTKSKFIVSKIGLHSSKSARKIDEISREILDDARGVKKPDKGPSTL
jgi:serine/threonine protein kinase